MSFSTYSDLLRSPEYFGRLLAHFNRKYGQTACSAVTPSAPPGITHAQYARLMARFAPKKKEPHYEDLIKSYYKIGAGTPSGSRVTSGHVSTLISNRTHIDDVYESLRKEFGMGMRGGKLVPPDDFFRSLQTNKNDLVKASTYRMDGISPSAAPDQMFELLRALFHGLQVVPSTQNTRLVAVSKALHFLLPDLVMPIDSKVLRFFRKKGDIPPEPQKQFDWFTEILGKYLEITAALGLKQVNGDGKWWNWSVPKRVDNAIMGFWDLFSDDNIERIVCGHIDTLLHYLKA